MCTLRAVNPVYPVLSYKIYHNLYENRGPEHTSIAYAYIEIEKQSNVQCYN